MASGEQMFGGSPDRRSPSKVTGSRWPRKWAKGPWMLSCLSRGVVGSSASDDVPVLGAVKPGREAPVWWDVDRACAPADLPRWRNRRGCEPAVQPDLVTASAGAFNR